MKKATAAQFKLEIDVVAIVSLVVHPRFYNAFSSFCPGLERDVSSRTRNCITRSNRLISPN